MEYDVKCKAYLVSLFHEVFLKRKRDEYRLFHSNILHRYSMNKL